MRTNLDNALKASSKATIQKEKKIVYHRCNLVCGTEHKEGCKGRLKVSAGVSVSGGVPWPVRLGQPTCGGLPGPTDVAFGFSKMVEHTESQMLIL